MRIIRWCIQNPITVNLIAIIIVLAGMFSLLNLKREMFPESDLDQIMISVAFPGANPDETEEGICVKIEQALVGLAGVKKISATAAEGAGIIMVEIESGRDLNDMKDQVETRINGISTFPTKSEKSIVQKIEIVKEVLNIVVSGPLAEIELRDLCEQIKDDLLELSEVSKVSVSGLKDFEISIELREEKLRELAMTFEEVARAIRANSLDLTGGKVKTSQKDILLRTKQQSYVRKDFEQIIIRSNADGGIVLLADIADIRDAFADTPISASLDGVRAGLVSVYKTSDEDIIEIAQQVKKYLKEKETSLPAGVRLYINSDSSTAVQSRIQLLSTNGLQGLVLVFLCLWLFLNFQLSIWVTLVIPVSLLGTFVLLYFFGQSLNMMSLFGLIMALGMLVDNGVVISESIYSRRTQYPDEGIGKSALFGTTDVFWPVIASVSTTIVAFLPLMFMNGIMGKFVKILPITVISCLVVSLFDALISLPSHLAHHLPEQPSPEEYKKSLRAKIDKAYNWLTEKYGALLVKAVNFRYITMGAAIAILLLTLGLVRGGFIQYVMMGVEDSDVITAKITFPEGSSFSTTQQAVEKLTQTLKVTHDAIKKEYGLKDDLILSTYTISGQHSGMSPVTGANLGEVSVELVSCENRSINSNVLINKWREVTGQFPGARSLKFSAREMGPGGTPISIQLRGHDFNSMKNAANELKTLLLAYPGVYDVDDDLKQGLSEVRLTLKPSARALGINLSDLVGQVRSGFFGEEVTRLQRGEFDVRVYLRFPTTDRRKLSTMENMIIRTPGGKEVPLMEVADMVRTEGVTEISRVDGKRIVKVSANLDEAKISPTSVTDDITSSGALDQICRQHGVSYAFEGHNKEDREAIAGLIKGFGFALLGIYLILATIFSSYVQPIIIMLAIPFGIVGALLGHMIMGKTLTLMSLFGLVALSGVVVNNSLILIDFINSSLKNGSDMMTAVIMSGKTRLRPILITTISTIAGVLTLMFEKSFEAQMLVPMAITLAWGLMFSTVLTLFIIPSLYAIMTDFMHFFNRLLTGKESSDQEILVVQEIVIDE